MNAEERKKYIGGTDISAVMGLNRWKTPLQIWGEKSGEIEPEDISSKMFVRVGTKLEQTVAELFTEETGKEVRKKNETIYHPNYRMLAANIDRKVTGENALLECKTASAFKKEEWENDNTPQEYYLQVMWYLALTGYDKGYIACLCGNNNFYIRTIERDEELIKLMIERAVDFWTDFVIPKVMPVHLVTEDDTQTIINLGKKELIEEALILDDKEAANVIVSASCLKDLKSKKKELDNEIKLEENKIKILMKDHETMLAGDKKITWKYRSSTRVDSKKLKADHPDIYENCSKTSSTRYLVM